MGSGLVHFSLDLVVHFGGVPVIVPRVADIHKNLDAFSPFHGVLLCEGEDISPEFRKYLNVKKIQLNNDQYTTEQQIQEEQEMEEQRIAQEAALRHPSDATVDKEKDLIEFELMRMCLREKIPALGICRGAQVLNVVAGGTLYHDVEIEIPGALEHIQYGETYDTYRHPVDVLPNTPLARWFDGAETLDVSSYHHQGVKSLASRFSSMARSPDGLVEGFYDPNMMDPENGRFLVGLQFHPERMQSVGVTDKEGRHVFEYPGCTRVYEAFVLAAQRYKSIQRARCLKQLNSGLGISERELRRRLDASGITIRGGRAYLKGKKPLVAAPDIHNDIASRGHENSRHPELLVKDAVIALETALRAVAKDRFLHTTLTSTVTKLLASCNASD